MNNLPLLQVENLKKTFTVRGAALVHAVNNVSFQIRKGETLGLVGESGSGKTTLGRTILRLTEPDSGKILFRCGATASADFPGTLECMHKSIRFNIPLWEVRL